MLFRNRNVTRAPRTITIAETTSTRDVPPEFNNFGIKNTPNIAPTLPIDAAMPVPNPRVAIEYIFGGSTYVTRWGPILRNISKPIKATIEIHLGQL